MNKISVYQQAVTKKKLSDFFFIYTLVIVGQATNVT